VRIRRGEPLPTEDGRTRRRGERLVRPGLRLLVRLRLPLLRLGGGRRFDRGRFPPAKVRLPGRHSLERGLVGTWTSEGRLALLTVERVPRERLSLRAGFPIGSCGVGRVPARLGR